MLGRDVTLSIVSHGQNSLVNQLLGDVREVCAGSVEIILTQNIGDPIPFATENLGSPVQIVVNSDRKGFGANHNAAFTRCRTPYFCVCNPDIRLPSDPFPALMQAFSEPRIAAAGPLVRGPEGRTEDSARRFPTAGSLLNKIFSDARTPDYPADGGPRQVDWLAGMFIVFRSEAFRVADGFDESYFLYYEDVDLCKRLQAAGKSVLYVPGAEVVHDARRGSRREPRLAMHHLRSMLRFLSRP